MFDDVQATFVLIPSRPVILENVIFPGSCLLMKISCTGTQIMSSLLLTPVSLLNRRSSTNAVISVSYDTLRPIAWNLCSILLLIFNHTKPFVLLCPTSSISFNGRSPLGKFMRMRSSSAFSLQRVDPLYISTSSVSSVCISVVPATAMKCFCCPLRLLA